MDPQRQYAQLLTLWSQGTKLFRREAQYREYDARWDAWWRLGRRLVERRLLVLPVPLQEPVLVAATESHWFTLASAPDVEDGITRGPVVVVADPDSGPALHWGNYWSVRYDVALQLGLRGWDALLTWPRRQASAAWQADDVDAALTVLGALHRHPYIFHAVPMQDWVVAARLVRHPGQRRSVTAPLPASVGFRYDVATGQAWWPGQDEDSVHLR